MTDEQTARKIVSDAQYDGELNDDVSHEQLEAAIVRALQQARESALDTKDRIIAVLRAEVLAYREWQRTKCDDNASSLDHWHACKALDAATLETDRTHALDAAKFGGA